MMVSFAIIFFLQNWNSPRGMPFIENTSGMISKARNLKTRLRKKEYKKYGENSIAVTGGST